jgi:hypothetical protein
VELQQIVERYAEGLAAVDTTTTIAKHNPRTGDPYPISLKSLSEPEAVRSVSDWWTKTHPGDFTGGAKLNAASYPYPLLPGATCDHALTTDGVHGDPEWAIEVKKPELIGNNGKRNDFAVAKMLSPYLKDRSLLHDVVRLRGQGLGRRRAVLGYTFRYDAKTCARAALLHPGSQTVIDEIARVAAANQGSLDADALINFCEGILRVRNLITGLRCTATFSAWRSPCGGEGQVFAWEVSDAPGPQHPW